MKRLIRPLSRISWRLMAFNLLLVFLPVAGVLYLDTYEEHLVAAQERSLSDQARLVAAALSGKELSIDRAQEIVARIESSGLGRPPEPYSPRIRVIDAAGHVFADTYWLRSRERVEQARRGRIQKSRLYRAGAFLLRPVIRWLRPPVPRLETDDFYETSNRLLGPEVQAALSGKEGASKRIAAGARALTLYRAAPVRSNGRVAAVVLVSQSTYPILRDLYSVRLGILQIFVASLVVAVIISLWIGATIVRPLRELRLDAHAILDRSGRLRGRFRPSQRQDEIGDLARALERLTRRLDEHVRFIESFASDVSHEFKNPLASIRTASEMLADVDDPRDRARFLVMIEQEVARMERLLTGVRDITLADAQIAREPRERVQLDQLLRDTVEGLALRERDRIRFVLNISDLPLIEASRDRLTQVFSNLLENAVSFSPPGGTVAVTASHRAGLVEVRIVDEGPGIPEAHLSRIFDRFFSYRPNESKKSDHTGLGLAIAKTITEGYGGTIRARNNVEGGAAFTVVLPAA